MSKYRKGNKEVKKPPLLSSKEKKAARQAQKHGGDPVPFLPVVARV